MREEELQGMLTPLPVFLVAILLASLAVTPQAHSKTLNGTPKIIDGDTIKLAGEKIRLHGIDTPETKQTCHRADGTEYHCGVRATEALKDIINNTPITCKGTTLDRYKRWIMECYVGDLDVNSEMVRRGWALAYTRYSKDYVDEQVIARDTRVGMWQGEFMEPWKWRRIKRK